MMIEELQKQNINLMPIIDSDENDTDINPTAQLAYEGKDIGNFTISETVGIYNPLNTSHLNVVCLLLFYMKPVAKEILKMRSQSSPIYELSIILKELDKPGGPVEPRKLMHTLGFTEDYTQNAEKNS